MSRRFGFERERNLSSFSGPHLRGGGGATFPPDLTTGLIWGRAADVKAPDVKEDTPSWLCRSVLSRTILENSKAIVYVKDLEGRYVFINRQFEAMLGVSARNFLGKTDHDLYEPETAEVIRANDSRVMESGAAIEIEEVIPVPDPGGPRVYVSVKEPLFDHDGRAYALCGISTDITERKRAEEALRLGEERYRSLVEATAAIVWSAPESGEFESEQPGWSEFTGQTFEELRGRGWLHVVHPDDREETLRAWSKALRERDVYRVEHRIRRRDGVYRDMCVRGVPILAPDGTLREWMGVHVDVSDRKAVEKELRESRQRHAAAMAASGTGTYRWDFATGQVEWDDQLRALFEAPPDFPKTFEDAIGRIHPDDRPALMAAIEEGRILGAETPMEFRALLPDGGVRWLSGKGRIFLDEEGRPSYSIGGCVDVTSLKLVEERITHRANHDALTGMPNRHMLQATLESFTAAGPARERFALLLLDLDRFKEINDAFGHEHGDAVLRGLKPRLDGAVTGPGLVARLGGDEFGVLLDGAGPDEAAATAEAILASLERPFYVDGQRFEVDASIGVALFPDHGRDVATLMRVADIAMYAAKRGHSGCAVYHPEQDQCNPRRLRLIGELRRAVEEDQLLLHYQPKIDLKTMEDAGAEALVRWRHPREGILTAEAFVPLAEDTGLIRPLSLWVLDRALRDGRTLAESGVPLAIAVNIAPDNLQEPGLTASIIELLDRHGMVPGRLTIEVTEGAMMRNPARAKAVLRELHELGVRIAIDDFGTGYSSLGYLKELPVDEVKVDRSFVVDMAVSRRDACIVRSVIDLGHNLGLRVVAEGVENEATLDLLRDWGCDLVQGFHLGRPLPVADLMMRRRCAGVLAS
ncbi:EAL domain-containing protein [Planctomyces sp. SH-PL62]|uniref:sensor domain-containing protein n=1 Tax=Planctomyces sp. SH-PL62 TaxID=1636152 RepID=UPI00078BBBCF|nr:EAL domain-containing protein [Planctomyces sp. SH-PL62]AMV38026.1 Phytochrome-like protein cph2 [Planctomyces sp. SH-PL62]